LQPQSPPPVVSCKKAITKEINRKGETESKSKKKLTGRNHSTPGWSFFVPLIFFAPICVVYLFVAFIYDM
jgi:hypothetical protein